MTRLTIIVDRRTYDVKLGLSEEAVTMLTAETVAEMACLGVSRPFRIYVSRTGKYSQVAVEWEYENLADAILRKSRSTHAPIQVRSFL